MEEMELQRISVFFLDIVSFLYLIEVFKGLITVIIQSDKITIPLYVFYLFLRFVEIICLGVGSRY